MGGEAPMHLQGPRGVMRRSCCRWTVVLQLTCAACLLGSPGLFAQTQPRTSVFGPLQQLSRAVEALVTRVSPSVVQVLVTGYGPREGSRTDSDLVISRQQSLGSGVVIDADGYILTNAHVVTGAQRVEIVVAIASTKETHAQSIVIGRAPDGSRRSSSVHSDGRPH